MLPPRDTPDLTAFSASCDAPCDACHEDLGRRGARITLGDGGHAFCLACAALDHLAFQPAGDAALTRRVLPRANRGRGGPPRSVVDGARGQVAERAPEAPEQRFEAGGADAISDALGAAVAPVAHAFRRVAQFDVVAGGDRLLEALADPAPGMEAAPTPTPWRAGATRRAARGRRDASWVRGRCHRARCVSA